MRLKQCCLLTIVGISGCWASLFARQTPADGVWKVKHCANFTVTGDGNNDNWKRTSWVTLPQRNNEAVMTTNVKILYSGTGLYFLFDCKDHQLSVTMQADGMDLWKEDVAEVFLWTDTLQPAYFEYEISPLNYELPILISNYQGDLVRWQPFHYEADRQTQHATAVHGGDKKSKGTVSSWTAEFFIPYKLLRPLNNHIPSPGTQWKANLYRVDYDKAETEWSWQLTGESFHDIGKFGRLLFE
jgi:hypothetical protein